MTLRIGRLFSYFKASVPSHRKKIKVTKALIPMGYFTSHVPKRPPVHRFSRGNWQMCPNTINTGTALKTKFLDIFWVDLRK